MYEKALRILVQQEVPSWALSGCGRKETDVAPWGGDVREARVGGSDATPSPWNGQGPPRGRGSGGTRTLEPRGGHVNWEITVAQPAILSSSWGDAAQPHHRTPRRTPPEWRADVHLGQTCMRRSEQPWSRQPTSDNHPQKL